MARKSREREIAAEERFCEQAELLEQARQAADIARRENQEIINSVKQLEGFTDFLSEEEIRDQTAQLYRNLQSWVEQHYGVLCPEDIQTPTESLTTRSTLDSDTTCSTTQTLMEPIGIYGDISHYIFNAILSRFIVGTGNPTINHLFRMLDEEVQQICGLSLSLSKHSNTSPSITSPPQNLSIIANFTGLGPIPIRLHWRSATSIAALQLARTELEGIVSQIAEVIEARYFDYTTPLSNINSRAEQLKGIIWDFVNLKGQIERQDALYYFWWVLPYTPFREGNMITLPESDLAVSNGTVEYCLSPALYKLERDDTEPSFVRHAFVKIAKKEI
ncbi:uncharacterized protein N7483_009928 [Penicillium malachiteum]|uniref:uncharacterized protein n=1 Tax=Penicillium malachiteum TaxID=1324776 RepID=UPI0025499E84|nr:uncharacterized protein N7483_009928 [Penicillium malachiteum]KAJ5718846.1 hypothetical protein N7483_009928 [Penicillium malachiteum]